MKVILGRSNRLCHGIFLVSFFMGRGYESSSTFHCSGFVESIRITLSENSSTCLGSCKEQITPACFCFAKSLSKSRVFMAQSESRLATGSSARRIKGSARRVRTIASLWRSPLARVEGPWLTFLVRPSVYSSSTACSFSSLGKPKRVSVHACRNREPLSALFKAVDPSANSRSWWIMPTGSLDSAPILMFPDSALVSPLIARSKVVLPEPELPMMPMNSPFEREKERSRASQRSSMRR